MLASQKNLSRFVITLLCCAAFVAAGARTSVAAPGPQITVRVLVSSAKKPAFDGLRISVAAPGGKVSWLYDAGDGSVLDNLRTDGLRADGWYTAPGVYTFVVTYTAAGGARKEVREEQEFKVGGKELRVDCFLWFGRGEGKPFSLGDFRITRVLQGSGGVLLAKDWVPSPEATPRYKINSRLKEPVYGEGLFGNFFGRVETEIDGSWVPYPRGGFCGTVGGGRPIPPGGSADSIEGYFLSEVKPFVPGRYRYVLGYTVESADEELLSEGVRKNRARKRVPVVYEIYDEFYIGG